MLPISLKSLAVLLSVISLSTAASLTGPHQPSGTIEPAPYYLWTTGTTPQVYSYGSQLTVQWSIQGLEGSFIAGKGYNPGSASRTIAYSTQFQPITDGNSSASLSIYGWTRNPLVEYHILESYTPNIYPLGSSTNATVLGTTTCDGSTYNLYLTKQIDKPSIDGNMNFLQFWSVRTSGVGTSGKLNGVVTVGCHANAWRTVGMNLGSSHSYQILATEAIGGSGSSVMVIS